MAKIVLSPGEALTVNFAETDGEFLIEWATTEIRVSVDLDGSHIGKAGVIYREVFEGCTCDEIGPGGTSYADAGNRDPRCPEHGEYSVCRCAGVTLGTSCPVHGDAKREI